MRYFILLILYSTLSLSAVEPQEPTVLFCKVWGFLKYHHPAVARGTVDWDQVFLRKLSEINNLSSHQAQQNFYRTWLQELGPVKAGPAKPATSTFTVNADFQFLEDTLNFSADLREHFQQILHAKRSAKSFYVERTLVGTPRFTNEKTYADSVYPSVGLRLLGLARYWNCIQYFFPYKYLIGKDWNQVLADMVPRFRSASDTTHYHLAMLALVTSIEDSHALFSTKYTMRYFGELRVPFFVKIIDDEAVVSFLFNDSLCAIDDIKIGDRAVLIDGKLIREHLREKEPYLPASNGSVKLRGLSPQLFSGSSETIACLMKRDGQFTEKNLQRYPYSVIGSKKIMRTDTCRLLPGNIAYLNLGLLTPRTTKKYLKKIKSTKGLIIDVRNYPNGTMYQLSKFLNTESKPFARFTVPDLRHPGYYRYTEPYYCGKKNKNPYQGEVILLFNDKTQSHAEFTVMALQTAPKVKSIGSQTAGADGNVTYLYFPGNYKTAFTALGVYYPDGRETQRVGLVPDIYLLPDAESIKEGRDFLLEEAIEILKPL